MAAVDKWLPSTNRDPPTAMMKCSKFSLLAPFPPGARFSVSSGRPLRSLRAPAPFPPGARSVPSGRPLRSLRAPAPFPPSARSVPSGRPLRPPAGAPVRQVLFIVHAIDLQLPPQLLQLLSQRLLSRRSADDASVHYSVSSGLAWHQMRSNL